MRFAADGPSIPDELLNARDEGRVVFFCGAGVSRAKAKLPNFFTLAERVIEKLDPTETTDARKILQKAIAIQGEIDVPGLISADRVFGILERKFTDRDIYNAIACELKPTAEVDLTAHRILLRLARTAENKTQLVTTNFDRLFEDADETLTTHIPPRLPSLNRKEELNGIVYLHGRVTPDYATSDGDGLIVSSFDFGKACLSQGWAREFFREIARDYVVVFVGYSADDPPILYLLEGFQKTKESSHQLYAFQADDSSYAIAQWEPKDVQAIGFSHENEYRALWETLAAWAERADAPEKWQSTVLERSMIGPAKLTPHERGQVAHIVSTERGARAFSEAKPPADWLCVLDRSCRLAEPSRVPFGISDEVVIDPYSVYGLDSDPLPERKDPNNSNVPRTISKELWDAFAIHKADRSDIKDEHLGDFRDRSSPQLPNRLRHLRNWFTNVSHEPAAIWWAAKQDTLHASIRDQIDYRLKNCPEAFTSVSAQVWRYRLESWNISSRHERWDWLDLRSALEEERWSSLIARRVAEKLRPYLTAGKSWRAQSVPPNDTTEFRLQDYLKVSIECPLPTGDFTVPDEYLDYLLRRLRESLELAVTMCKEVGNYQLDHLVPLIPDNSSNINNFERANGISGLVVYLSELFAQLTELDVNRARQEFWRWPTDDETAFSLLRIWASGLPQLITPEQFAEVILGLSDEAFWRGSHQRDLLLTLARRWSELRSESTQKLEQRLLSGPQKWESETYAEFVERNAWHAMNRLQWLAENGCTLSLNLGKEIASRQELAPSWKPEYSRRAAESREMKSGPVAYNTDCESLRSVPIDSILRTAEEQSGRRRDDMLEEFAPFKGLCDNYPRRAYLALARAARQKKFPKWAWTIFLSSQVRADDSQRLIAAVAVRTCKVPDRTKLEFLHLFTAWLSTVRRRLSKENPNQFDNLLDNLIEVCKQLPEQSKPVILGSEQNRDWATDSLNSPVGQVVMAVCEDERIVMTDGKASFPAHWESRLEKLLELEGDSRRHAIAMLCHHLGWLHHQLPKWTDDNLVSVLKGTDPVDHAAFWGGFFWNPKVSSPGLFLQLKPHLLRLVHHESPFREGHVQAIARLVLRGWMTIETEGKQRVVRDDEMRSALLVGGDDFRHHIIWQIQHGVRSLDEAGEEQSLQELVESSAELFSNHWPRNKSAKTSVTSLNLAELLFCSKRCFPQLAEAVLPHFVPIDHEKILHLHSEAPSIAACYPRLALEVLLQIVPDDVRNWPWGIGDVLETIAQADDALALDQRFIALKRRWDAR